MTDDAAGAPHLDPEEFRRLGHQAIDWVADYLGRVEDLPVVSPLAPGDVRARLPEHPPEHHESFDTVLADLDDIIVPGLTHWQSPDFYAYFPANASGPSILGELISAGLGVQGMSWATSPACTELETHVCDWMVEACGLPDRFRSTGPGGGVIQDSASSSTLVALLAARTAAGSLDDVDRMCVYASSQAHSSIVKGARVAGIPDDRVRSIAVDDDHAMRPDALAAAIAADRAAGRVPIAVVATVGSTSSTAIDPVPAIAEVCDREDVWLHVDGAFAGSATVCEEMRHLNDGLDRADSYVFNPHKWLLTNFDCSLLFVADRAPVLEALSILPEYLRNAATESGSVIDYRDWQVPLGRRFRALKLWFVVRHYGLEGLRAHIRHGIALAAELARWVDDHPDFVLAAPVTTSLVCFRHTGGDDINRSILDRCNRSGALYLTHTVLDDRVVLRMAIGAPTTEARHVRAAWDAIVAAAEGDGGRGGPVGGVGATPMPEIRPEAGE